MYRFGRSLLLPFLLLLFAGAVASPAFGQCVTASSTPDVNADDAVTADDALILYYSYSLASALGTGRGSGGEGGAAAPSPLADGERFHDCDNLPEMVVVPSGTFTMGSPESVPDTLGDERPVHEVTIGYRFAVSRYEVTFAEWDVCVSNGGCTRTPGDEGWEPRDTRPVIHVSWDDAQEYVAWLSRETGETYRLLSESEWEYAARASSTTAYYWGDRRGKGNANCLDCGAEGDESAGMRTAPVGSYPANDFGLYDMAGNVQEWVEDCWHGSYGDEDGNVIAPDDGTAWQREDGEACTSRVIRGAAWGSDSFYVRPASRFGLNPETRDEYTGFRVARELD